MSVPHTPLDQSVANVHPTAVDNEIARLRQTIGRLGQQIDEGLHTPSAAARQENNDNDQILDVLNLIRADIHALSTRVTRIENAETHAYHRQENDNDEYRMTYGRTERDIRNRRSTAPN